MLTTKPYHIVRRGIYRDSNNRCYRVINFAKSEPDNQEKVIVRVLDGPNRGSLLVLSFGTFATRYTRVETEGKVA